MVRVIHENIFFSWSWGVIWTCLCFFKFNFTTLEVTGQPTVKLFVDFTKKLQPAFLHFVKVKVNEASWVERANKFTRRPKWNKHLFLLNIYDIGQIIQKVFRKVLHTAIIHRFLFTIFTCPSIRCSCAWAPCNKKKSKSGTQSFFYFIVAKSSVFRNKQDNFKLFCVTKWWLIWFSVR